MDACLTCSHRHTIGGRHMIDCYSVCPDYQSRMAKRRAVTDGRRLEQSYTIYLFDTKARVKKAPRIYK